MSGPVVLIDASVLYSAPVRDLLMHLAIAGLFQPRWSDRIHEEWIEGVLRQRPDLERKKLQRTRRLMNRYVRSGLVEGFEHLISELRLPDQNDRHVLAAAIHSRAVFLLTFNLRDFPEKVLSRHGILPSHPDDFLSNLLYLHPKVVTDAVKLQRSDLKNPPYSVSEFLETLEKAGLPKTSADLSKQKELL